MVYLEEVVFHNVVVTFNEETPVDEVVTVVDIIQLTPMENLTIFVGPKIIVNDKKDFVKGWLYFKKIF